MAMKKATIFNIQRYCLHDGPGIRTTVFFKGCPLKCVWCHNPESQRCASEIMHYSSRCTVCGACLNECPSRSVEIKDGVSMLVRKSNECIVCGKCVEICRNNANELCGKTMTVSEIFSIVMKDKIFYGGTGGMTLSGGEPALQSDAALELLRIANSEDINTVIETCGVGTEAFFKEAATLGAMFYFDIKAIDTVLHKQLTGMDNFHVLNNLLQLMRIGAHIVIRLPLVPGVNDGIKEIRELSCFLRTHRKNYDYAEIMPYHNLGKSKACALSQAYNAPSEGARQKDKQYWIDTFAEYGINDIHMSK